MYVSLVAQVGRNVLLCSNLKQVKSFLKQAIRKTALKTQHFLKIQTLHSWKKKKVTIRLVLTINDTAPPAASPAPGDVGRWAAEGVVRMDAVASVCGPCFCLSDTVLPSQNLTQGSDYTICRISPQVSHFSLTSFWPHIVPTDIVGPRSSIFFFSSLEGFWLETMQIQLSTSNSSWIDEQRSCLDELWRVPL